MPEPPARRVCNAMSVRQLWTCLGRRIGRDRRPCGRRFGRL